MSFLKVLKGVSVSKEKRSELVGALVTLAIKQELSEIAEQDDRSLSFVGGALIERGLELYRRDHLLKSKGKDGKLGVIKTPAKTEESPRKKKQQ